MTVPVLVSGHLPAPTTEDGTDAFVHHGDIQGDAFKSLSEGESVTFDRTQGPKGLKAVNVVKG